MKSIRACDYEEYLKSASLDLSQKDHIFLIVHIYHLTKQRIHNHIRLISKLGIHFSVLIEYYIKKIRVNTISKNAFENHSKIVIKE